MSSECAPRQSTCFARVMSNPSISQVFPRFRVISRSWLAVFRGQCLILPKHPGSLASLVQICEFLLFAKCVHGPEILAREAHQLSDLHQPLEWRPHQVLPRFETVKNILPKHEETAVDKQVRVPHITNVVHHTVRLELDHVKSLGRRCAKKCPGL